MDDSPCCQETRKTLRNCILPVKGKVYASEFKALQGATAEVEGKQSGEQTEPYNRPIAQVHFPTSHLLVQKFTI